MCFGISGPSLKNFWVKPEISTYVNPERPRGLNMKTVCKVNFGPHGLVEACEMVRLNCDTKPS